jgi:transposase
LPDPPYKGGRVRTPMPDVVFAVVAKVYSTVSSRRFGSDLADAFDRGYLSKPMHPNKVNTHLENPDLFGVLKDLIARSALPLRCIESDFAADSSGFSTSRHVRWFDERYGTHRSGRDWVKVHLMTGCRTNCVTAVEIQGRDAGDSPQFKPLVEATVAAGFKLSQVCADKGYLSRENLELVAKHNATAYIPFKSNSQPGEVGTLWEKMYGLFQYRREEFLRHYHKRSNVESTFSMIKAKFGDAVRSRTDVAMRNEALCKVLAHNLCCVIQAQCELGIDAVFFKDEPERAVLPMKRIDGSRNDHSF